MQSPVRRTRWAFLDRSEGPLLDLRYVASLRTFLAVDNLELDLIAFLQALISVVSDRAVVHEDIRTAILAADKAEAFRIIEPLYGSFQSHFRLPPGIAISTSTPKMLVLEFASIRSGPEAKVQIGVFSLAKHGRQEYGLLNSLH